MPGWGGTIEELTPLGQALSKDFRVIAADLPGSGKSGPQPRTYAAGFYNDDPRTMLALLNGTQRHHLPISSASAMVVSTHS